MMLLQDEDVLSDAHKCLEYAWNHDHDCPKELRERLGCNYHQKSKEEKEMRKTIKEKRNEISEELLEKLKNGEPIEEIEQEERILLERYYIEGHTFKEISKDIDYTAAYCGVIKRNAIDKIEGNDTVVIHCSYEHDDGSQCGRKKEFEKDQVPEEWYCWQHEDAPKEKSKELSDEEVEELNESLEKRRPDNKDSKSEDKDDAPEVKPKEVGPSEIVEEDDEYMLVMIVNGEAQILKSDKKGAVLNAGEAVKESDKFDEVIAGTRI